MYVYVYRSVYTLHLLVFDVPYGCSQDLIYKRLRQKRDELLGKEADYERSAGLFAKGGCCSKKKRRSSSHHNCKPTETFHYHVSSLNPRPIVVKTGLLSYFYQAYGGRFRNVDHSSSVSLLRSGMYCGMHPPARGVGLMMRLNS